MFGTPVCWRSWDDYDHLYPVLGGRLLEVGPWPVRDLLSFLSQIVPGLSVRRVNQKDPGYKYVVESRAKLYVTLVFSKDLRQAAVEIIDESFLPVPIKQSINGRNWSVYCFRIYSPGWIGDMRKIPVLHSLFKSFSQICRGNEILMHFLRSLFGLIQNRPGFERGLSVSSQFATFLRGTPGYFLLHLDRNLTNIPGTKDRSPLFVEENGVTSRLVAMSWLCDTVVDAFTKFSYCELDATFFAMKPYVMCVPQFIVKNCAYPVGIILAPSESEFLYNLFYQSLGSALSAAGGPARPRFTVLSDGGKALRTFCERNGLTQFQCHRHLIEWFGANSILKTVFLKLLRSSSVEEFQESLTLANGIFMELCRRNDVDSKLRDKYLSFTGQVIDGQGRLQPGPGHAQRIREWAIWARGTVTTCSNHAESFHRVLKSAVKPNGRRLGLGKCLLECADAIRAKQSQWKEAFARNLKGYLRWQDDTPVDMAYVAEVARRFELPMPNGIDPSTPEREVIELLLRQGEESLGRITLTSLPVHPITRISSTAADDTSGEHEDKDRIRPPDPFLTDDHGDRDPRVQIAKDLWASLGDRRRPDLYPWVFHWTQQALEEGQIDLQADRVRAYLSCWDFINDRLRREGDK